MSRATTWLDRQKVKEFIIVKPVLTGHSNRRLKISFQDRLLHNAGHKYCRMLPNAGQKYCNTAVNRSKYYTRGR